jgi:xylulose-5-phosphate/fructose-6-phosphate phosphoketolase
MTTTELDANTIQAVGPARATIAGTPLSRQELDDIEAYWRACCYLILGMLYLRDNPLLREPLSGTHIKARQLGHWGSSPGQAFIWVHLNRIIKKFDLNLMYISGPGHGAPGVLAPVYLDGTYSEIYSDKSEDTDGLRRFFRQFSFPGGIGSHCTPETPGSIHEGGELGYSLSHAYGTVFDNPNLITVCVVGDGEAETGPLATSWHSNKYLNPITDGAVLPILHLNGYKINNPTLLSRIPHAELEDLFIGYGYRPYFVEGSEHESMHQALAATLDQCVADIRETQEQARNTGAAKFSRWPMIILRSPKGWTAPAEIDGHKLEGFWRAHQVPIPDVLKNPLHLQLLENWMRSYRPEELFDEMGRLIARLRELSPRGARRIGANPHANGGILRKDLRMPDFRNYGVEVKQPGSIEVLNTHPLGVLLRDIVRQNPHHFRVFGPDETTSNKLDAVYEATKKTWLEAYLPEDTDGGELGPDGHVMEMLSEHTLEGWLEGYLLSGRHGFFATYESFVHVVDSMVNQHAKWLEKSKDLSWRAPISSLNLLITSTVWRQDHNGFTHQDPGFLDIVANKSPNVTRIYLPPDVNTLLSTADHCLRSKDYVNVIVCDKQPHLQYLDMESAITHCAKGIGLWEWASTDQGVEPDVVVASAGDTPTLEALAATAMLRSEFPELKLRFINVVDLFRLQPDDDHPHGLSDRDFDSLFTADKPVIFNFHAYPWMIHRLTYRRRNHENLHVRGYKEKGSIDTPLELAIRNQIDRFTIAMDVIDRVSRLQTIGAHARERLKNRQIACIKYAYEHGVDDPEMAGWKWPF